MKPYGLKITDILGATYSRWFNTDGVFRAKNGVSVELLQLGNRLNEMSLKRAIKTAEKECSKSGMYLEILYEKDFTE
jgi:hypothetical protein